MTQPSFAPGLDEGFEFNAERIGHPVDVIEVGDHLSRVVDGAVIQSNRPQRLQISRPHRRRFKRELFGIGAQGRIHRRQGRAAPIAGDGMNISVGFRFSVKPVDLSTEVMGVRACSVFAVVGAADDDRQHLALRPR